MTCKQGCEWGLWRERMSRFVVHEHHSRRLHWDFRLEMDGVLKSWAVPKGVPIVPGEKRLAVEVDDHELAYIDFEGEIAEGDYGAGAVKIWDKGAYEITERKAGLIVFELQGTVVSGPYRLVRTGWEPGNKWLLIRGEKKPAG